MSSRRRTGFSDLVEGGPGTTSESPADSGPPTIAPIDTIAPNPDNPRDPQELDLEELMESITQVGILQPIVVMSSSSWLKLYPHHGGVIGDVDWVVVGGNRRLEAARALAWVRVPIHVRDNLADGADDDDHFLDEAVMVENIHRKNLAPLKEAAFLQRLVARHGSQGKVAKRIGKTQAYVSQRLALLNLDPELQEKLSTGELKVKDARQIAALPPEQQTAALETRKKALPATTHNPVMDTPPTLPGGTAAPVRVPSQQGGGESADSAAPAETAVAETHNPVMASGSPAEVLETPAADGPSRSTAPTHNPVMGQEAAWGDPEWVVSQVRQHMTADGVGQLVRLLSSL